MEYLNKKETNVYVAGGLLAKQGVCNLQHATAVSFLILVYARYLKKSKHVIRCNDKIITQKMLVGFTKKQVGTNNVQSVFLQIL